MSPEKQKQLCEQVAEKLPNFYVENPNSPMAQRAFQANLRDLVEATIHQPELFSTESAVKTLC
jgi:histidinol-phosphate/aromatic aminotransferase/cobyric acid decarboxylase-like protein